MPPGKPQKNRSAAAMQLALGQIAELVGGRVIGNPDLTVSGIGSLDDAVDGQITFLANPKFAGKVATTRASAVILPPGANGFGKDVIETRNPYLAFAKLLTHFTHAPEPVKGVMEGAVVCKGVKLGADVSVYPGAYIGEGSVIGDRTVIHPNVVVYNNVTIGDDVVLHSNVSIREKCRVGNRVIVHNGAVIGSDGFGYVPDGRKYFKIPQIGIVIIEDDVEIGANTTIDRAALDVTLVRRGVKLDNLVQVAHNCSIGEDTAIAAQTGIAGSVSIGNNVTIGGQSAISGHLKIGDNIMLGGRAGVTNNMDQPGVFSGLPAIPHKEWLKTMAVYAKLPEMRKTIKDLEERLSLLEKSGQE
jgi:UDP-3-O-[3-hydroxymyristoyl] glucosamine N-acyltransferase